MRSRPKVSVYLDPAVGVAGQELTTRVVLLSGSETPVDAITLTLRGVEWVGGGNGWQKRSIVGQQAKFGARTLEKGKHELTARFVLPADAAPSHAGRAVMINYELEVHVSIPWWPDRHQTYVIPVTRRAPASEAAPPKVFTNRKKGAGDVHLEATVDSVTIEQGGAIAGVVSFANVAARRIKSVELVFHAREGFRWDSQVYWVDGATWVSPILERAPREGESVSFRVKFPEDATISFDTPSAHLNWTVAVAARVSFGEDLEIEVPLTVTSKSKRGTAEARRRTVLPPVGRERRALLFRAVGEKLGLEVDAEAEEMKGVVGAASLVLRLEQRDDKGLFAVAELAWPALGMNVSLRERRWTDAFGDVIELDKAFDARVHVSGQDPERVRRMFDEELRVALLTLASLELDDDGALLGRPVSVLSTESMLEDVAPLYAAAERLGEAVARVATTATAYR